MTAVPAPATTTTRCSDGILLAARTRREDRLVIDGYDHRALGLGLEGRATPRTDPWHWINSGSLRYVVETAGTKRMNSSDAMHLHAVLQRGHVAILRASVRVAPTTSGTSFTPGRYSGTVFIMNLRTQAVHCHGVVTAKNSVDFSSKGGLKGAALHSAAIADLRTNFEAALTATLKAMATKATVEIGSRVPAR